MKITGFELGKLSVPLKAPFKIALRTVDHMEDVVLILETDTGHRGFGSAPATAVIGGVTFAGAEISISDAPGLGIENISELSMLSFDKVATS